MAIKRLYWPENALQMASGYCVFSVTRTSEAEPVRPQGYTPPALPTPDLPAGILQRSPIGGLCRRADEPHRRIHRPGFDGLFLHTTGGITRERQNVLAAHGRERSGRNFRRFHGTDGAEIACPPRTEQQGGGTAFPIADSAVWDLSIEKAPFSLVPFLRIS